MCINLSFFFSHETHAWFLCYSDSQLQRKRQPDTMSDEDEIDQEYLERLEWEKQKETWDRSLGLDDFDVV